MLFTILAGSYSFPRQPDLLNFVMWLSLLLLVFLVLLIGSMFILPADVELVPRRGPIRLDI